MKQKFLILVLVVFLTVLVLKNDIVEKKEIFINNDNYTINVAYPFFNDKILDEKISNYILDSINIFKYEINDKIGDLSIDYDYNIRGEDITINFYKYSKVDNIVSNIVKVYNYENGSIINEENIVSVNKASKTKQRIIDPNKPMVAFTFDDGPNYNTLKMIDVLVENGASATFFVLGNRAEKEPSIIHKIYENNLEIGNHTYSHKQLNILKDTAILEEVNKTQEIIFSIIGDYPTYLRPSYGIINNKMKKIITMPMILWNIDTLDWKYHNSTKISNKIYNNVKDGDIVLMHDIYSATVNAVADVIPKLKSKGFQIVSISELYYYKNNN
ncbi:MAG: polysaccharide deacetylase family protein [bacterium]|nr:polysaccharide deacetylase family protein [bacterium]